MTHRLCRACQVWAGAQLAPQVAPPDREATAPTFRKLRIAPRLTLLVVIGGGLVLGATVWQGSVLAERFLRKELEAKAEALAVATANEITAVERGVAVGADGIAAALEELTPPTKRITPLIESVLRRCPRAFGSAVAFAPGASGRRNSPYVYRSGDKLVHVDLAEGGYKYEIWDWYTLPKELRRPVWTEPYFDVGGGNILMATYSVPLLRAGKQPGFWGVATCDLSLEWLSGLLKSLPLGETGYAFLISSTGTFIAHPDPELVMNETIFSIAEERHSPELREVGHRMIHGESGFVPYLSVQTGKPSFLAYTPVKTTGWSLGVVFPQDAIIAPVRNLRRWQLGVGAIGFAVLLFVAGGIARSITGPLQRLEAATQVLASGNLDVALPQARGEDEVAHLTAAFARMRIELKASMEVLRVTTAARERMARELEIAHAIQLSMVPKTFPPFPERTDLDLYAVLDPAKEVGGDFYDLFLLDDDHLCIAIGDVSDKGVPAALFMAVTRTLFKSLFRGERDPAHVLSRLNYQLAQGNDTGMFVTLFCAVVDLRTGECRYANGGHNPPFLLRARENVERLPLTGGMLLGLIDSASFREAAVELRRGDTLFLYTDGLTEALNTRGEFLGDERAQRFVEECRGTTCREMVERVRGAVRSFRGAEEESDDIAVLAFTYLGPAPRAS